VLAYSKPCAFHCYSHDRIHPDELTEDNIPRTESTSLRQLPGRLGHLPLLRRLRPLPDGQPDPRPMLDHRGEDLPRLVQLTAGIEHVMADDASEELSSDRVPCPPTGPSCHAASGKVLSRADGLGGPIHLVDHGAVLAPLHRHRCRTVDDSRRVTSS
jgi:hypothetical protein